MKETTGLKALILHAAFLTVVISLHLSFVYTIVAQPLDVNRNISFRSPIWQFHHDTRHRLGPASDFFSVYHSGTALSQGTSPYLDGEKTRRTPYFYTFRYLPLVAQTVGLASGMLAPGTAYMVWVIFLEAVLFMMVALVYVYSKKSLFAPACAALLLLNSPYMLEVHLGQFTFVSVALACAGLILSDPRLNEAASGALSRILSTLGFMACVILKFFPIVGLAVLLKRRRLWIPVAVSTIPVLAATAVYFLMHSNDWAYFVDKNFSRDMGGLHAGNHGMIYFMIHIINALAPGIGRDQVAGYLSHVHPVLVGITMLTAFFSRHPSLSLAALTVMLAHFTGYAHVWEHHSSGIILIGVVVLMGMRGQGTGGFNTTGRIIFYACLIMLALPTPLFLFDTVYNPHVHDASVNWPLYQKLLATGAKAVPDTVMYALCMAELCSRGFVPPWRKCAAEAGRQSGVE